MKHLRLVSISLLTVLIMPFLVRADVYTLSVEKSTLMKPPTEADRPPVPEENREVNHSSTVYPSVNSSSKKSEEQPIIEEFQVKVVRSCQLRTRPTENSVPTETIPKGAEVKVTPYNKNWHKFGQAFLAGTCLR